MAVKDYSEIDQFWSQFVEAGSVFKRLATDDIADSEATIPNLTGESYRADMALISKYLTASGKRRLQDRFKNWKSRQKLNKSSITISGTTLERLRAFARASGLDQDNYDLMLELLLDPDEQAHMESTKQELEDSPYSQETSIQEPSSLYAYILARTRSTPRLSRHLHSLLKMTFVRGWRDCKSIKGRKTEQVLDKSLKSFLDEFSR